MTSLSYTIRIKNADKAKDLIAYLMSNRDIAYRLMALPCQEQYYILHKLTGIDFDITSESPSSPSPSSQTPPPQQITASEYSKVDRDNVIQQQIYSKPDPLELKKQGWRILGPYWTDYRHKSKFIRIQQANGRKYHRYQIGKDITEEVAKQLLEPPTEPPAPESKQQQKEEQPEPAEGRGTTIAERMDGPPKLKSIVCKECGREVWRFVATESEQSKMLDVMKWHQTNTGHSEFDVVDTDPLWGDPPKVPF